MTSSPVGRLVLLKVPLSFRNREPILDDAGFWPADREGERSGIVSTLVDADTSVGVEIWLGFTRLRDTGPAGATPSARLVLDGDLLSASIAASALRWTSRASWACSCCVGGSLGDDGWRAKE